MKITLAQQYITYTLDNGKAPESVYLFCKTINLPEADFYKQYSGFESLEMSLYKNWFEAAFAKSEKSKAWKTYGAREKVLSVFYTFIEELLPNRSFVVFLKKRDKQETRRQ
jgi:hypothetical protein